MKLNQTASCTHFASFAHNQNLIEKIPHPTLAEKNLLEQEYDSHLEHITFLQQQIEREEHLLSDCMKKLNALERCLPPQ